MEKDIDENESLFSTLPDKKSMYNKTFEVTKLVKEGGISCNKSAKICKILSYTNVRINTSTQAGVYKSVMREALKVEEKVRQTIPNKYWSLHFDGKKIKGFEHQVVLLKMK